MDDKVTYIAERRKRLRRLSRQFHLLRKKLTCLEPTAENLEKLWACTEDFKDEILQVSEAVDVILGEDRVKLSTGKRKVPTGGGVIVDDTLLTNPFLYHHC
jgi:hypothetical protein